MAPAATPQPPRRLPLPYNPRMDAPRKVYVEPTTACNLDCRTCVRHAWDEPEGFMAWEVYEAVVEGLARAHEAGAPGTVALMGLGEPLLHPRFLDMVRTAKERGLRVEVTTNGLLLEEALARGLVEAGLDQLVVSIDGASAETFGRVRSGAPLERVIANVSRLRDFRGPYYGSRVRIGIEFVAMRSNIDELPQLPRVAARLGASFVLVSNVLPYTAELAAETLYERGVTGFSSVATSTSPAWRLPLLDWDAHIGEVLGRTLATAGSVSFCDADRDEVTQRCPFVHAGACAVAWHGGVSPCPPLLHTYTCFVRGRQKLMRRWEVGRLPEESLADVWARPAYAAFRERVERFDFPPCTDCGCELAESNEEDCYLNPHPVCGDCLWARGVVRCA